MPILIMSAATFLLLAIGLELGDPRPTWVQRLVFWLVGAPCIYGAVWWGAKSVQ